MSRGIADTSVFIEHDRGLPLAADRLPDELAISVVTVAELRAGVLAAPDAMVRSRRLNALTVAQRFDPLPVDEAVAEAWALLQAIQPGTGATMASNRSWIVATAMAYGLPLVTRDDGDELPGLELILV